MISKKRITIIASASILIALLASMQTIDIKNEAFAEGPIPKWIKKTAVYWASSPEVSDSVYLEAMAWLINNGIMVVDTATAVESAGPIDKRISDLDKRIDKLESSSGSFSSSSSNDEMYYRIFSPHPADDCDKSVLSIFTYGWCPDNDQKQFDIEMPKESKSAEAAIVWAISSEGPYGAGCEVLGIDTSDEGRTSAFIWCETAPAEDTPMTMLVIDVHGEEGYEDLARMAETAEP
ncbi:MAG: hypothetical protein H8E89_07750 [Candidatus Nitrosopelagicus sp.]|nr:hypothetical protein [Candidatus Nitrosopelagicus sp.]